MRERVLVTIASALIMGVQCGIDTIRSIGTRIKVHLLEYQALCLILLAVAKVAVPILLRKKESAEERKKAFKVDGRKSSELRPEDFLDWRAKEGARFK